MSRRRILILGHARHGKDTAAEYLRDQHGLTFRSSSLFLAERVVKPALAARGMNYASVEACYADRVNHRAAWREIIGRFYLQDPSRLAREILARADCYVGMRMRREYDAARPLFDCVLWIDASGRGVPPEGRDSMDIEFDPGDMVRIDNGLSVTHMHAGVSRLRRGRASGYGQGNHQHEEPPAFSAIAAAKPQQSVALKLSESAENGRNLRQRLDLQSAASPLRHRAEPHPAERDIAPAGKGSGPLALHFGKGNRSFSGGKS